MKITGYCVYKKVFNEEGVQVPPYTKTLVRKTTKKKALEYIKKCKKARNNEFRNRGCCRFRSENSMRCTYCGTKYTDEFGDVAAGFCSNACERKWDRMNGGK